MSVRPPAHPHGKNPASTGQIFMKFDIITFFEKLSRKFKFYWNMRRIIFIYEYLAEYFLE